MESGAAGSRLQGGLCWLAGRVGLYKLRKHVMYGVYRVLKVVSLSSRGNSSGFVEYSFGVCGPIQDSSVLAIERLVAAGLGST